MNDIGFSEAICLSFTKNCFLELVLDAFSTNFCYGLTQQMVSFSNKLPSS